MLTSVQAKVALAAAVLVLAAAVARIATRDDETSALSIASPTPLATVTSLPTAAPAITKPKAAQATAVPAAPTPAPAATPSGPAPVPTQPKAGIYTYRATTDGQTDSSNLRISNTAPGRQSEDEEGIVTDVYWKSNGKYEDKTTFGDPPDNGFVCDMQPDPLELKVPMTAGSVWTLDSKCTIAGGGSLELSGSVAITGKGRASVGGQAVDTWKVHSDVTVTARGPKGSFTEHVVSDDDFAPAYGLYVISVEKDSGTDPSTGKPANSTTTKELVSLTPGA